MIDSLFVLKEGEDVVFSNASFHYPKTTNSLRSEHYQTVERIVFDEVHTTAAFISAHTRSAVSPYIVRVENVGHLHYWETHDLTYYNVRGVEKGAIYETSTPNEPPHLPNGMVLHANFPNPFNPITFISYELAQPEIITLAVYDALGQQVSVLHHGLQSAGLHSAPFDASNLPSGLYVYRLHTANHTQSRKMLLVK